MKVVPLAGITEETKAGVAALLVAVTPLNGAMKAVPPAGTTEEMKAGVALLPEMKPSPPPAYAWNGEPPYERARAMGSRS